VSRRSYRALMSQPAWLLYNGEELVASVRAPDAYTARGLFGRAGLRGNLYCEAEAMKNQILLTGNHPLLNFYWESFCAPHPLTGKPVEWPTVEHYFQACKVLALKKHDWHMRCGLVVAILESPTPRDAKAQGRGLSPLDVSLWDRIAFMCMLQGQLAKFNWNEDLANKLLATGSATLVEHRPDPIWGDNIDGTGKNLCGKSLMQVRRILQ
jgi:N-glycosidase YbiA